jgi:hypothetical protein
MRAITQLPVRYAAVPPSGKENLADEERARVIPGDPGEGRRLSRRRARIVSRASLLQHAPDLRPHRDHEQPSPDQISLSRRSREHSSNPPKVTVSTSASNTRAPPTGSVFREFPQAGRQVAGAAKRGDTLLGRARACHRSSPGRPGYPREAQRAGGAARASAWQRSRRRHAGRRVPAPRLQAGRRCRRLMMPVHVAPTRARCQAVEIHTIPLQHCPAR